MPQQKNTTHFGFKEVPTHEKSAHVAEVFHSVASKYDVMNDVMSLGMHRLWKKFTIEQSGARPGQKILDIAGGTGDQGKPGGDPDSKNYTGNGGRGNSGVAITRGLQGRKFVKLPSFQDEFNENAKVAIDITVDGAGNVVSAVYQPRGSTTADAGYKAIAIRKALQIKLNNTGAESTGTIVFNFRLNN